MATRIFSNHLILAQHPKSKAAAIVSLPLGNGNIRNPNRRAPCLDHIRPLSLSKQNHPNRKFTVTTRVLDLVGPFEPDCDLTLLASAFPRLDILRLITHPSHGACASYIPVNAKTIVVFVDKNARTKVRLPRGDTREFPEPQHCSKLVINFMGSYEGGYRPPSALKSPLPPNIKDLVAIAPDFDFWEDRVRCDDNVLMKSVGYYAVTSPTLSIEIVGISSGYTSYHKEFAARLHEHILRHYDDDAIAHMFEMFKMVDDSSEAGKRSSDKHAKLERILDRIKYTNGWNYEAAVGKERFRLEAVEHH